MKPEIFMAGGTGYLGSRLIPLLLQRGYNIRALTRPGSETKLPRGCETVVGNALDEESYVSRVKDADTFVHLVGVSHPSPAKAPLFRRIDLAALRASVNAAVQSGISHFVYVSVAHPAPVMKAYVESRMEAEKLIQQARLNATILRPWYVLGPGHRWAYSLTPLYWLFRQIPATREIATRLGLVTLPQMLSALVQSVEHPAQEIRFLNVPDIRNLHSPPLPTLQTL